MPYRTIPARAVRYAMLSVDRHGRERNDDPDGADGRMSASILADVAGAAPTDVFLFTHGWKGDMPAAVEQFDRWIGAFEARADDRTRMRGQRPGFVPYHIGLHWPSQPWGEETFGADGTSFSATSQGDLLEFLVQHLDDTPAVRAALGVILAEGSTRAVEMRLTPAARQAYMTLDAALGLGSSGPGGDSGSDRQPFNPDAALDDANGSLPAFAGLNLGGWLSPLRQLSFWTMKKRAQTVGETGFHSFLSDLQREAPGARLHLMGHSFGCIVVSAALGGPGGGSPLPRPVDSAALVQGAMSLWSFSPDIPLRAGTPGYFHRVVADGKVRGPIVTTQSAHDRAVRVLYPFAAGAAGQIAFAGLPEYGGIGAHGVQGVASSDDRAMLPIEQEYAFQPGRIYNLEASQYIFRGRGVSGAHCDIDGSEVAHVLWQAALV